MKKPSIRESLIIISLWGLMFVSSTQYLAVFPLLPLVRESLGVEDKWLGLFISVYSFSMLLISLVAGLISDRIGRKKVLLWGSLGMAITLLLHFFVSGFWTLALARILTGMSGGFLSGAVITYIRDRFKYDKRGWAAGKIYTGSAVGQVIGVPFAIMMAQPDFRTPFVNLGIAMLVVSFLIWRSVPSISGTRVSPFRDISEIRKVYINLFRSKPYRYFCVIYASIFFSVAIFLTYFPVWIERQFNFSQQEIAFVFLLGGTASLIANPVVGKISDWVGRGTMVLLLSLFLFLVLGVAEFLLTNKSQVNLFFFVAMFLISGRTLSVQNFSTDLSTVNNRGLSMGLLLSTGHMGTIIGSGLSGVSFYLLGFGFNMIMASIASIFIFYVVRLKVLAFESKGEHDATSR